MSDQTIDLPPTVPPQNTTVARQDNAMAVADILAQVRLIQEVMGKVMQEGVHFGKVPGCGDRMTLLQPGAQKLTMTFRLAPEYHIQETNYDRGHKEYRVICTLKSIASGSFVGQGVGCCSTLESKYRWRGGARKCPECGKETIIKGKAEYGGGWLCFGKKGGCGEKWPDGSAVIEDQSIDKVEHDSPADFYNTVLKMAKKRAFVDATITATASSDFLTQDIGDDDGEAAPEQPPRSPVARPATPAPQRQAQPVKAAPSLKPATPPPAPVKDAEAVRKFLLACKARLLALVVPDDEWAWWHYAVGKGWILANESLLDATADKMFEGYDPKNIKASIGEMFDAHCTAVNAMASNCPPEMRDEVLRGFVAMPQPTTTIRDAALDVLHKHHPEGAETKAPNAKGCPACQSTATTKHDDLIGVRWCKACGIQWQDGSTVAYEEHEWQWAKLPFAPKDKAKDYKGLTLGQIARLDNKYWFGIVSNFKAEPYNGRPPSAESVKFADACEEARKYLESQKTDAPRKPSEDSRDRAEDDQDSIPF